MQAEDGGMSMREFVRRVIAALLLVGLALLLWRASDVLLLLFGGVLVAVIFRGTADRLSEHMPIPSGWALALVVIVVVALLTGAAWLFGSQVAEQFSSLSDRLPKLLSQVRNNLGGSSGEGGIVNEAQSLLSDSGGGVVSRIAGMLQTLVGAVVDLVLVIFIGLYMAAQPGLYRRGLLLLAPRDRQQQMAEVLDSNGEALWWWLIGQLCAMAVVGLLTFTGLSLLGMPMALALALLAGLLNFVPFAGPILSSIPAILVGFSESASMALYVAGLYLVIQQIEGNFLEPMIQRKAVALPPVLTVASLAFFGLLFGPIGILFATPLAVVTFVTINIVYVRNVLGHGDALSKFR